MLLRAMVAEGQNDMFIAGDTHQRIYDNHVSLGSLGIAIRGRSSRLTLSYRSTHEILSAGEALLGTEDWDDLDGGTDTLKGYRSVLHGNMPCLRGYGTWAEELVGIVRQVKQWQDENGTGASIGIAVPIRRQVAEVESEQQLDRPAKSCGTWGHDARVVSSSGAESRTMTRRKLPSARLREMPSWKASGATYLCIS